MADKVKGMLGGMKKHHHQESPESATAGDGQSLNPAVASADGPHPTNPTGETNAQGGAALTDENGNLKPGPHTDAIKRESIFTKIKDKLHGDK